MDNPYNQINESATQEPEVKFTHESSINISKTHVILVLLVLVLVITGGWYYKKQRDDERRIQFAADVICVTFQAMTEFSKLHPEVKSETDLYSLSMGDMIVWQQIYSEKMQLVLEKYNLTAEELPIEAKKAQEFIKKSGTCSRKLQSLVSEKGCMQK